MENKDALINYCLRVGDSSLVLGQRLAEWCSNGPILEEDIALTNISLDLFGQSRMLYSYIAELKGNGETEDSVAFGRNERAFYNTLLSERPNGHFGDTIVRGLLVDAFNFHFYTKLKESKDSTLAAFAEKSLKEVTYHLRHSSEWIIRLGDGTEESKNKVQKSLNELWGYSDDLFEMNDDDLNLVSEGVAIDLSSIKPLWQETINTVLSRAKLTLPENVFMHKGSRNAVHSEYLGHLLCEMQYLQKAYPDAKW
ncbi:MAG TPA: phenylacetate-CoA oxygenase subunit PaaI [Crocinitomicaceae bacterium]|nr:phenylacetate-CoA oxygenase subunit PaaI [Crocinitomicaceae bacterium]